MKTNVGVFFGGRSVEHEISIISALQAINAFDSNKYNVIPIYITKEGRWLAGEELKNIENYKHPETLASKSEEVYMRPVFGDYKLYRSNPRKGLFKKEDDIYADLHIALPVLHGSHGEDGMFEGFLETVGIPYAGCDTLSSANGMDKITMKMILKENDIPVVDYVWFTDSDWNRERDKIISKIEDKLGYPVIVKPANLGSSVGIEKAKDKERLIQAVGNAEKFSKRIIVEKMIENLKEINCSVLGDYSDCVTSVCEEPISHGDFLSYDEKYGSGSKAGMQASEKRIPADLPASTTENIKKLTADTFKALGCHGVSRVDVMIDKDTDKIYVNEINTIPGSLSFYLWEETGISFTELIDRLMKLALKRKRENERKTFSYNTNILSVAGGGTKSGLKSGMKTGSKR